MEKVADIEDYTANNTREKLANEQILKIFVNK